jgi:integrase
MAKRIAVSHQYVTFYKKPRKNRDGSLSILTLVRVPGFDRFSKTFKTQQEAEAWALPLAKDLMEQKGKVSRPNLPTLTISELINQYLDDPNTEALKSYEDYADRANWWKTNYGSVKVLDFDVPLLYEARNKLRMGGRHEIRSAATVNRHLAVMRLIWNWGKDSGWRLPNDNREWPKKLHMKEPDGRKRFLSPDEMDTLLKAAEADPMVKAAIQVSITTGVRQGELLRLKWADVDFTNSHITIFETKNATPRSIHLVSRARAALQALKAAKVVSPTWVFTLENGQQLKQAQLEMRWRRIREAAGLVNFRWHDLRHTCASYLAQNGATLLEIAEVLGHKTMQMVKRYAHLVQGAPVKGHAALDEMLKGK